MIGIYKITSPTKRIYIGQSIDIKKRFNAYKNLNCKTQPIIYKSILKYGFGKHKFEVLCECEIDELNDKERYYQDVFSAIGENGLNCRLTKSSDRSGKLSEQHKIKIGLANKGKINSEEHRRKISEAHKSNKYNLGSKRTEETKIKMGAWQIGRKLSEEHIKKIVQSRKGYKHSEETKLKMSKAQQNKSEETRKKIGDSRRGKKHSEETLKKMSYLILNTQTGIFYFGTREAATSMNINRGTLKNYLCGHRKNKTPFIYV